MGPQILSAPSPSYPESARASNVEGTTVVGLIISVNGNVTSAWVESSSGNSILDQTAVNAVYGWQFVPAKQNGVAVEAQSRVPVSFTLKRLLYMVLVSVGTNLWRFHIFTDFF